MNVDAILITQEQIQNRVKELAVQISKDYADKHLTMVCVLKGAIFFFTDLVKSLSDSTTVELNFIELSSYSSGAESSGRIEITRDLGSNFSGKEVMIIDDIVDTGFTLSWLVERIKSQNPASLKICCLLNKNSRRQKEIHIDYIGFEIPNYFVVGYGLDYKEKYRNLRHISILRGR